MITVNGELDYSLQELKEMFGDARIREIKSPGSGNVLGYSFESRVSSDELKSEIEEKTGFGFEEGIYSIEETSAALSSSFWENAIKAMLLAFFFIIIVVFLYFRKIVPSSAIVLSAISDIVITLAVVNVLNIRLSTAGIAAILMLIGYSVDSNILLTTKVVKQKEGFHSGLITALKTGLTMQITTIVALSGVFFFSPAEILKSITLILIIGILVDMMNTWIQNASILRWWSKKNE
jgi:preprotein translocase subunit SecF